MDYDLNATAAAREQISGTVTRGICGVCDKPMYRQPPYPGVPIEWKHTSTSHTISWNPEKHLAALVAVEPHQHRFEGGERLRTCAVVGCDAQMVRREPQRERGVTPTAREAKDQESRLRGNRNAKAGARKAIPF